jgi:hypothetical protein
MKQAFADRRLRSSIGRVETGHVSKRPSARHARGRVPTRHSPYLGCLDDRSSGGSHRSDFRKPRLTSSARNPPMGQVYSFPSVLRVYVMVHKEGASVRIIYLRPWGTFHIWLLYRGIDRGAHDEFVREI